MRRLKAGQEVDLASREGLGPDSGIEPAPLHRHRSEIMPRALVGDDDITPFVLHDNDLVDDLEDLVAFDSLEDDTETEFDPELTRRTSLEALARATAAPPPGERDEAGESTVATSPTTIGDPRVTAMRELYLRGDTENALSLADEIASMIPPPMAAPAPNAADTDEDVASEASFGIFADTLRPRTTR